MQDCGVCEWRAEGIMVHDLAQTNFSLEVDFPAGASPKSGISDNPLNSTSLIWLSTSTLKVWYWG